MAQSNLVTDLGGVIPYAEYHEDTQTLSYIGKRFRSQRVFTEIDHLSAYEFAANMIGWSELRTDGVNQYIHRVTPKSYPAFSVILGRRFLYARELVKTENFTPSRGTVADPSGPYGRFVQSRVTIGYETVTYPIRTDADVIGYGGLPDEALLRRYVTRHVLPSGEYLQLPRGSHRWTDGTPASQSLGRSLNRADFAYTWHEVPGIPTAVYTAVGTANLTAFDGQAAQKLYLVACEAVPYKSMAGNTVYDITYRMRWCGEEQPTHNHFLRFRNGLETVWDIPVSSLAGVPRKIFQTYEFANLFRGPFGFTA